MTVSWTALVGFALAAALSARAQRTWVVDRNGGPGVDCTDIQSCVNSARPGDRIAVVAPGGYPAFTLTQGIEVEGVPGVSVPGFTVSGVPAGHAIRVIGLGVWASCGYGQPPSIQIVSCAGPVLLSRVVASSGITGRCLSISGCGAVLLLDCWLDAGRASTNFSICPSPAVSVTGSLVTFQRCTIVGSSGLNAFSLGRLSSSAGYPGLVTGGGHVTLVQTECRGGWGGNGEGCGLAPSPGGTALSGGPGLLLGSTVVAGPGGFGCPSAPSGHAISGAFRVTANCVVQGATSGITSIPDLAAIQSPGAASLGGLWNLALSGTPGTILFTGLDIGHGHIPLPGFDCPFLLTTAFIPFLLVTVGGTGNTPWPLPLPMDPALRGRFLFVQGVALPPGNPVPSLTTVGDVQIR